MLVSLANLESSISRVKGHRSGVLLRISGVVPYADENRKRGGNRVEICLKIHARGINPICAKQILSQLYQQGEKKGERRRWDRDVEEKIKQGTRALVRQFR